MSTLLDVLRLEIEMQAGRFIQGQKELQDSFDKLNKHLLEQGKKVEAQHRATADSIGAVSRELQGMFTLVKGGLAAEAFKTLAEFGNSIANVSAGLGRLSANVGMPSQALQAWGMVLQQFHGSQEDANSLFQTFAKMQTNWSWGGGIDQNYQRLFTDAGMAAASTIHMSPEQQALTTARAIQEAARRKGRRQAYDDATNAHLPESFVNAALDSKDISTLQSLYAGVQKNVTSPQAIEAGKDFQQKWAQLTQALDKLSTIIFTYLEPPLSGLVSVLTKFAERLGMSPPQGMRLDPEQNIVSSLINGPHWVNDPYYKGKGWLRNLLKRDTSYVPPDKSSVVQSVIRGWKSAGMSDEGIAGVLRNIPDEAKGFDPAAFTPNDQANVQRGGKYIFRGTEAVHGHGLYQLGGDAWNLYQSWIDKYHPGANWRDPDLQNEFMPWYVKKMKPAVWARMASGTASSAAQEFLNNVEIPRADLRFLRNTTYGQGVPGLSAYLPNVGAGLAAQSTSTVNTNSETNSAVIHNMHVHANDPNELVDRMHVFFGNLRNRRRLAHAANGSSAF